MRSHVENKEQDSSVSDNNNFPVRNSELTFAVGPIYDEFVSTGSIPDDQWAWNFLRLNPSYRLDYELWSSRADRFAQVGLTATDKQAVAITSGATREALLRLDSRYFVGSDDEALGPAHADHSLESICLGDFLHRTDGEGLNDKLSLKGIRLRSFDAPRSYGIGGWLDPRQPLPSEPLLQASNDGVVDPSWFFHASEPIWSGQGMSMAHQHPPTYSTPSGEKVMLGAKRFTEHFHAEGMQRVLQSPMVTFKMCLDGYLKRQLATAQRVVHEYREALALGKPSSQGAEESAYIFKGTTNPLDLVATRQRKNWYEVTLDVNLVSAKTFDRLKADLKAKQDHLKKAKLLTVPVRQRALRKDGPDADLLTRALCVFEMQRLSYDSDRGRGLTQEEINEAIYCFDRPTFYEFRGIAVPDRVRNSASRRETGFIDRVREGLEFARRMMNGEYEFLVS